MKINEFIKYEECAWNWSLKTSFIDKRLEEIENLNTFEDDG